MVDYIHTKQVPYSRCFFGFLLSNVFYSHSTSLQDWLWHLCGRFTEFLDFRVGWDEQFNWINPHLLSNYGSVPKTLILRTTN